MLRMFLIIIYDSYVILRYYWRDKGMDNQQEILTSLFSGYYDDLISVDFFFFSFMLFNVKKPKKNNRKIIGTKIPQREKEKSALKNIFFFLSLFHGLARRCGEINELFIDIRLQSSSIKNIYQTFFFPVRLCDL